MDRTERLGAQTTMLEALAESIMSGLYVAMPCVVQSFDPAKQTVEVQPTIQAKVTQRDGSFIWIDLPLITDVLVFFQKGGGFTLTFPISLGDECLVIFADRCIDSWWSTGQESNVQSDIRMHSLSDGFALVGFSSAPKVISNISTSSVQLRNDDATTVIDVSNGNITLTAPTMVTINAPDTTVTGNMNVQGLLTYENGIAGFPGENSSNITGDLIQSGGIISSNGIVLDSHTHGNVENGGGTTGGPS